MKNHRTVIIPSPKRIKTPEKRKENFTFFFEKTQTKLKCLYLEAVVETTRESFFEKFLSLFLLPSAKSYY